MDWDAWARRAERAIDVAGRGDWRGLFADGATFTDPANPTTGDLRTIARDTAAVFPDWTQEITTIRGGDTWAFFEWIGRATYRPPDGGPGDGAPIEMHGATVIEVDADGLVTAWRDYLDRKEPEQQIRRFVRSQAAGGSVSSS
jgi:SnoaL-like protein